MIVFTPKLLDRCFFCRSFPDTRTTGIQGCAAQSYGEVYRFAAYFVKAQGVAAADLELVVLNDIRCEPCSETVSRLKSKTFLWRAYTKFTIIILGMRGWQVLLIRQCVTCSGGFTRHLIWPSRVIQEYGVKTIRPIRLLTLLLLDDA